MAQYEYPENPGGDDESCEGFDLTMPFVAVASEGGAFDDQSFVAGWTAAGIDVEMEDGVDPIELWIDPRLVGQIDLLAMRHGYLMTVTEELGHASHIHCQLT